MARMLRRDPFARVELWKENASDGECSWCGRNGKRYAYYHESDGGRKFNLPGSFCSISCMESENGRFD
jgi:hypothetical protein